MLDVRRECAQDDVVHVLPAFQPGGIGVAPAAPPVLRRGGALDQPQLVKDLGPRVDVVVPQGRAAGQCGGRAVWWQITLGGGKMQA